ncbi:DUF397 domain-containing protein [Streptomyces sp. NPDC056149]|uniref:DUF397 domain-containing protein n=1 Tax=Streptomyces sp. NPDC056149 TaxID=3345728 RepID=UPI0035DB3EFB
MTTKALDWIASSYSGGGGSCIEWAPEHAATTGEFLVRDSKTPTAPHLSLSADAWSGLVQFAKAHG